LEPPLRSCRSQCEQEQVASVMEAEAPSYGDDDGAADVVVVALGKLLAKWLWDERFAAEVEPRCSVMLQSLALLASGSCEQLQNRVRSEVQIQWQR
jgi:hypothetical protein